jgi:protein TonB
MASNKRALDYYEILGLPRDAGQSDIGAAFRSRILAIRDQPGSGEETRRINLAYRALNDPDRRRDYDEALTGRNEAPPEAVAADAAPPPPLPSDQTAFYGDDDLPEQSGGRRALLVPAMVALLLLLMAGAWLGGLFRDDPQVAATSGNGTGADVRSGADGEPAAKRGGSLANAIAALTGRDEPPPASPPEVETATATPPPPLPTTQSATSSDGTQFDVAPLDEAELARASEIAQPAEPASDPSPPPTAEPSPTESSPSPPTPVDQSAPARLLRGGLEDSDNRGGRFQGSVGVRLTIGSDGRPQACRVVRSSGNRGLDGTTCYLLQQRLVFSPARNRSGEPVQTVVESNYVWGTRTRRR